MRILTRSAYLMAILLLIAAGASNASQEQQDKEDIIKNIIEISGLGKQLEQYPAMVIAGIESEEKGFQSRGIDHSQYLKLLDAVKESFRAELFYQEVFSNLVKDYNADYAQSLLKWLSSPLVRKMAALEIEATTVEGMQAERKFAEEMKMAPPSKARMSLIQRLDEATNSTQQGIETRVAITEAMLRIMAPLSRPDQRLSDPQIEHLLDAQRRQLRSEEPAAQITFLFTYRSASDKELEEYIKGYETAEGIWLNGIINKSIRDAMVSAAANAARRIAGSAA